MPQAKRGKPNLNMEILLSKTVLAVDFLFLTDNYQTFGEFLFSFSNGWLRIDSYRVLLRVLEKYGN